MPNVQPKETFNNRHAVKLAELLAAHRDGMDGSDCSDINDPACGTCDALDGAIKALSGYQRIVAGES